MSSFLGRIFNLENVGVGGGPTKRNLQSLMEIIKGRVGGTRKRAGGGRVGDIVGAEVDA